MANMNKENKPDKKWRQEMGKFQVFAYDEATFKAWVTPIKILEWHKREVEEERQPIGLVLMVLPAINHALEFFEKFNGVEEVVAELRVAKDLLESLKENQL